MQPQQASGNIHLSGKCRVWLLISDLLLFKMAKLGHKLYFLHCVFTLVCQQEHQKKADGMEHPKALQPSSWNTSGLLHLGSLHLGNICKINFVLHFSVYSSRVAFLMKAL